MASLIFAICGLLASNAVLTWLLYLHAKDAQRYRRKQHLSHYKTTTIYKGSDR